MNFPLPPIDGGVDVYPWNQARADCTRLRNDPRPVIQSLFRVRTRSWAELNAAHLAERSSPDNILFDIHPLNNNFPSLEDGLSWPELVDPDTTSRKLQANL